MACHILDIKVGVDCSDYLLVFDLESLVIKGIEVVDAHGDQPFDSF